MEFDAAELERAAQRFRSDIWGSVTPDAVVESGVQMERFGPVQAITFADLPEATMLNQIHGAAEPGAVEDGHLARALSWMRSLEVDYRVPVAESRPGAAQAEKWLAERGCERGGGWQTYVRGAEPLAPAEAPADDIFVWELGQEEGEGEGLSMIAAQSLGYSPTVAALFFSLHMERGWRCYTASLGLEGPIVATGLMMIDGGVARLGSGTTLPLARGQGCNKALLRRRVEDAIAAGCHTIAVEVVEERPGEAGALRHNLVRCGFQAAYESRVWQRPALHPAQIF